MRAIRSGRDSRLSRPSVEVADDVVEADAAQAHRRFVLAPGIGDDHDRALAAQHRAGPRRVLAAEADVDAAGQVRGGELRRIARVEHLGADRLQRQHLLERQRLPRCASVSSSVGRSWLFSTAS